MFLLCSSDTEIVLALFLPGDKRSLAKEPNNGTPVRLGNVTEFNPFGLCEVETASFFLLKKNHLEATWKVFNGCDR